MKTVGIIAEFNPFHNGHQYIIEQAKSLTGAQTCVIVMSGDFVQSGKPAFCSKELRARMALACGADLVLLLPAAVSTASAELFAEGAVALLHSLGCVDYLCFGSETCDLSLLERIANVLIEEPELYRASLKQHLSDGLSYPAAREAAILDYFAMQPCPLSLYPEHLVMMISPEGIHTAMSSPNSILGIEYIKALKKLHSNMQPVAVPRTGVAHLETDMAADRCFCSATALRKLVKERIFEDRQADFDTLVLKNLLTTVLPYVPENIFPLYEKHLFYDTPISEDILTSWLAHRLIDTSTEELLLVQDCDEALANAISSILYKLEDQSLTYDALLEKLATKNYTRNRIGRVLIHLLLHIKKADIQQLKPYHYCLYARLLGFHEENSALLHEIKQNAKIPLISKLSDRDVLTEWYSDSPDAKAAALRMYELDILAGNQYSLLQKEAWGVEMAHEMRKGIIKA